METDFRKLADDCRQLLDALADRLSPGSVRAMRLSLQAGEWTEMVETLCADLVGDHVAVTREHREALAALLDTFGPQNVEDYPYINHKASTIAALNVEG